ncbi:hypothetical protein BD31_I0376 [Candidatus Nitrosopumilus salaria BD31]|uniref:Uncharacterized protein n=1 Tax=Candidatus Nitrosopumilus salarius BD31 TaxID=859350 RepID=I3D3I2_9ARCH|nr:hypothetical protein [Candidatus Nitrosopumilus salaria]EIJ66275.1 hypothetical protein BD31_I0376 [Candidatus Nitrosopumilus salaria BD31]
MKTRLLIIFGVLIIAITCTFVLNYYVDEEIKAQKFSAEQIDRIFKRCDYQKMMDDRNWIGLDGNKITDHQPLMIWNNSTHHLDNNSCAYQTIEKYESDSILRDALDRCWTGNGKFVDDNFTLWHNDTHYIDKDTCLITEATHSGISLDRDVYSHPFGFSEDAEDYKIDPIYIENPNTGGLVLDVDSMQQVLKILDWCHRDSLGLGVLDIGLSFNNETHYIDNNICEWQEIK